MNLIEREPIQIDLIDYRTYQYSLIPEFIDICFEYCKRFGLVYNKINIEILNDNSYFSKYHFSFDKLRIKIDDASNNFLELDIPKLIHGTFFKLRGSYYIPLIYILDEPITFKKNSIKLTSLFKPITLYLNDNRVILDKNNIPISRFLRIFKDDEEEIKHICKLLNTFYLKESKDETEIKLRKALLIKDDNIQNFLNKIFFDKWTEELYSAYYKIDNVNILSLLDIVIDRVTNNVIIDFNDLNYKRLVFIELLLEPLFKSINSLVLNLKTNKKAPFIPIKGNAIINHFYSSNETGIGSNKKLKGLSGQNLYSVSNGFSGLLGLKASFQNPKSSSELPRSISNIHYGYKEKICPITISNKDPGVVVSLVPNQKIELRYGLFK